MTDNERDEGAPRRWTAARRGASVPVGIAVLAWDRIAGDTTGGDRVRWWRDVALARRNSPARGEERGAPWRGAQRPAP